MKVKVGKISELTENNPKLVNIQNTQIFIVKHGSSVYAMEDICSHDGESISEGKIEEGCIVCPRHMARFNLSTGEALCMPATEPVAIFPVKIVGGEIEIEMEEY